MPITADADVTRIIKFFAFLEGELGHHATTLRVFLSLKIGAVMQQYVTFKAMTCGYQTISNDLSSYVAAARFVHATVQAREPQVSVDKAPIQAIEALLAQCKVEGREQFRFSVAQKPKAWLDWDGCQRARLRAEAALADAVRENSTVDSKIELTRDVCLLMLLTGLPPDRVRVYRELKLGDTLKSDNGGYLLDLSLPGLHKTSSALGPTCEPVPARVAAAISSLVAADGLADGDYLFYGSDSTVALDPTLFGRLVKSVFKKYGGVAMCPKDVRASYITWLRDGEHGDDVLRSAAKGMRHSSSMQASVHYDKHKSMRVVNAAMSAADKFASHFTL